VIHNDYKRANQISMTYHSVQKCMHQKCRSTRGYLRHAGYYWSYRGQSWRKEACAGYRACCGQPPRWPADLQVFTSQRKEKKRLR